MPEKIIAKSLEYRLAMAISREGDKAKWHVVKNLLEEYRQSILKEAKEQQT